MAHERPFVFGVPAKGNNFTDRVFDTQRLVTNFTYGVNTILISPRRWGKTSLVKKAAEAIDNDNVMVVYIDIFACHSEWDFLYLYATQVVKQTSSKVEEWIENAKNFLSRLMPKFSFGSDPMNDFSVSFDITNRAEDRNEILNLPEKIAKAKGKRIIICIDEFQEIAEFADPLTFQKNLRSTWQYFENVSFCLFGSKKHMMAQLFDSPSKPFYKFGDIINLERIPVADWVKYIVKRFTDSGKDISEQQARDICQRVDSNSSYVQQLSWITWTLCDAIVTDADIDEAYDMLIDQNGPLYEKQIESLTSLQLNYLKAMIAGVTTGMTRKDVIDRFKLVSSSNVVAIQKVLQRKEIIYIENQISYFCDPMLGPWLRHRL